MVFGERSGDHNTALGFTSSSRPLPEYHYTTPFVLYKVNIPRGEFRLGVVVRRCGLWQFCCYVHSVTSAWNRKAWCHKTLHGLKKGLYS